MEEFIAFKYLPLEITMEARENIHLPWFHGSTLRGVIGQTLRRVSCINKSGECINCHHSSKCPYTATFFGVNNEDTNMLTKVNTIPNPFVICPDLTGIRLLKEGNSYIFKLTLLGNASQYINYYIYAVLGIERMGIGTGRGKVLIKKIRQADTGEIVYEDGDVHFNNINESFFSPSNQQRDQVQVVFDTPVRIKAEGKFMSEISYYNLMRNVLRRTALMYEYHMEKPLVIDYKQLLEQSKHIKTTAVKLRWQKLERYSSHAGRKLSMGGLVGKITYGGGNIPGLPWLELGTVLHIGKSCTMGLGHYSIEKV